MAFLLYELFHFLNNDDFDRKVLIKANGGKLV